MLNRECKAKTPAISSPVSVRRQYDSVQMCITTRGCIRGGTGSCTICNYGRGSLPSADVLRRELDAVLSGIGPEVSSVLFGTCGSIFDEREFPRELLDIVLESAKGVDQSIRIIFETSYETVSPRVLERVGAVLGGRIVDIEMGLESSDAEVLSHSLNKGLSLSAFQDRLGLIHGHGFEATVNVIVGAPFLTPEEQVRDAADAVRWACDAGADTVALFPVNIKPGTALSELRDRGAYGVIPLMRLMEVLGQLPSGDLAKVTFSWVDSEPSFGFAGTEYPSTCGVCSDIGETLTEIIDEPDGERRADIVRKYLDGHRCGCRCVTAPMRHPDGAVAERAASWLHPFTPPFVPMAARSGLDRLAEVVDRARGEGLRGFGIVANSLSDRDSVALHLYSRIGGGSAPVALYRAPFDLSTRPRPMSVDGPMLVMGAEEDPGFLRDCLSVVSPGGFVLYTTSLNDPAAGTASYRLPRLSAEEAEDTLRLYRLSEDIPAIPLEYRDPGLLWLFALDSIIDSGEVDVGMWMSSFDRFAEYGITNTVRQTNRILMSADRSLGAMCVRALDFLALNTGSEPVSKPLLDLFLGCDSRGCIDMLARMSAVDHLSVNGEAVRLMDIRAGARRRLMRLDGRWEDVVSDAYRAFIGIRSMSRDRRAEICLCNAGFLISFLDLIPKEGQARDLMFQHMMSKVGLFIVGRSDLEVLVQGGPPVPRIADCNGGTVLWDSLLDDIAIIRDVDPSVLEPSNLHVLVGIQSGVLVGFPAEISYDPLLRYAMFLHAEHVIEFVGSAGLDPLIGLLGYNTDLEDGRWVLRAKADIALQISGVASRAMDPRLSAIVSRLGELADSLEGEVLTPISDLDQADADVFLNTLVWCRAKAVVADMNPLPERRRTNLCDLAAVLYGGVADACAACDTMGENISTRSDMWRVPVSRRQIDAYVLNHLLRVMSDAESVHDPQGSIAFFESADRAYRAWGNNVGRANLMLSWGRALLATGKADEAYSKTETALALAEAQGMTRAYVDASVTLAGADTARGRYQKAWGHLRRAEQMAGDAVVGDPSILHAEADILFAQGDAAGAMGAYMSASAAYDVDDPRRMLAESMIYRLNVMMNREDGGRSKSLMTFMGYSGDAGGPLMNDIRRNMLDARGMTRDDRN